MIFEITFFKYAWKEKEQKEQTNKTIVTVYCNIFAIIVV